MKTKDAAHKLNAALRQVYLMDMGGRHDADHSREEDAALSAAVGAALAACDALATTLRAEYPHTP